jgi:NAD(P)-dependent dehydrogenase (short-subunit alcohol dehydrogenase family)
MAGLDPAIHVLLSEFQPFFVDARNKSGHDDEGGFCLSAREAGMEISGTAALVSGGASGLGRATAAALARAGAKVALLDINAAAAEATAAELGAIGLGCDVTDAGATEAAVATARDKHGPARIVINCAGIGRAGRIIDRDGKAMPLEQFRQVVEVNLIGSFNLLRVAAADMIGLDPLADGERGLILMTASIAAYDGQIGQAAYSASKGGIVGLTLPAARELARYGIRVVAIAPGVFATPMLAGLPEAAQTSLAANVPFPQRLGQPEEYAALALHICGNRMLNGEVIRLDGALRMAPR